MSWKPSEVPELERPRADHAAAVFAFASANRAHFATSISDRGDAYFESFTERSQRVSLNAGFHEVGAADPSEIGGKQGSWFQRHLGHATGSDARARTNAEA